MNKHLCLGLLCAGIIANMTTGFAADTNPTCVLMKFSDETRYRKIEAPATLSDLVCEKLIASGKFNLKETKPVDKNMEKMLYNQRSQEFANASYAISYGDFSPLFEGPGFNEKKATTIGSAALGQIVAPNITGSIGREHGAEYLIHGNIIQIGTGVWPDEDFAMASQIAVQATCALGSLGAGNLLGPLAPLAGLVGVKKTGIGVKADLRVIKAATGEVVWTNRATGVASQDQINVGFIKIGSDKLSNELYYKALDIGAQKIVDVLVKDATANKMFVK